MPPAAVALGGAVLGGLGAALSGGPDFKMGGPGALDTQGKDLFKKGEGTFTAGQSYGSQGWDTLGRAAGFAQGPALQSTGAYNDLASLFQGMQQSGGQPTAEDIARGQSYAGNQFAQQRVNLQQSFDEQIRQANQRAALSGRGINDPILRAKLAQEQMRQGQQLDAAQSQFAGQYAERLPQERLRYAEGRVNALTSLDALLNQRQQQAFSNLTGLAGQQMGFGLNQQQLGMQQQQYGTNLQQADFEQRYNVAKGEFVAASNKPTVGSVISGALGGAGAGLGIAKNMMGLGGGGGGSSFVGSLDSGSNPFSGSYQPSSFTPASVGNTNPAGGGSYSFGGFSPASPYISNTNPSLGLYSFGGYRPGG